MKHIAKTVIVLMLFLINTAWGQTFSVSGSVTLEGQADHSGIKIRFLDIAGDAPTPEDSTTSSSTGAYTINIAAGYYLVEWTKAGYVPEDLGGLILTGNTTLDDVTMIPGSIQEVSGTLNTATWTTSNVFYVTGNCTIPSGQTLTINAGVRVKFSSGKGLVVNGKIIANGTSSSRIVFTSRESVPSPGDWDNIYITGTNSELSYFDYLYAANALRSDGNDAVTNTTIDNGYFDNLGTPSSGIYLYDGGGENITNNNINPSGNYYGIYIQHNEDGGGVTVTGNTITGGYGIYAYNSDGSDIISNTIVATYYGIYTDDNDSIKISQNNITGQIREHALYVLDGGDNNGVGYNGNNSTTNPNDYDVVITNNYIKRTDNDYDCCPNGYGIYKWNGNYGTLIKGNTVIYDDSTATSWDYTNVMQGITAYRSLIDSNYVEINGIPHSCGNIRIIYGYDSDITRNTIKGTTGDNNCDWDRYILYAQNCDGSDTVFVQNNTIISKYGGGEQWHDILRTRCGGRFKITDNTITAAGITFGQGMFRFDNGLIDYKNNNLKVVSPGHNNGRDLISYGGGTSDTITFRNSTFDITNNTGLSAGSWKFFNNNGGPVFNFYKNTVNLTGLIRGITLENAKGSIYNNTMTTTTGDYGLLLTDSDIKIKNNNLVGFTTSIHNDNSTLNFNINNNNTWDTSTPFSGTGQPPAIGSMIGENDNGTTADIYNNISQDPIFVYPDTGNYNLQASSALINAGDAGYTDADGSVADIGALYYHIYVAMTHTPLTFTNQVTGNYEVNAAVTSTAGAAVTAALNYAVNGGAVNEVAMSGPASDIFTGNIPAQALNSRVQYYITGTDGTHTATLPRNLDDGGYEFYVNLFSSFNAIGATSEADGDIILTWGTPTPISGTLTEYKVYKDDEPDISLTSTYLVAEDLDADATDFTDSNVLEGRTYYYKVVGVLSDGSESLIGPEVSGLSNSSTLMRLRGVVQLSDASSDAPDHSGAKVLMSAASPSAESDSITTDITGEIDIIMKNGLYNIYYSKAGYQTQALGDVFLAANMVLDTVTLAVGGMTTISGSVSGTLAGDTLYYVSDDIAVPSGETLTIEAGAQLAFTGDYSLTANGKLLVNGVASNRVKFTSGNLAKTAGDWTGIVINKTGSRISYADIEYSSSTIYVGSIDTVTINNCLISGNSSTASGIRINENLKYFIIRENTIKAGSNYGIHKVSGNNSSDGNSINSSGGAEIVGNTIYAYIGMRIYGTYNVRVDSNTILLIDQGSVGIHNYRSQNSSYSNNLIMPEDEFGWYNTGMSIGYNFYTTIHGNEIRNSKDTGIDMHHARNDTVTQNIVTRDWSCDNDDTHVAFYLHDYSWDNYFSGNVVNTNNGPQGADNDGNGYRRTHNFFGFHGDANGRDNTFVNNSVTIGLTYDDNSSHNNRGLTYLGDNAILEGNKIAVYNYTNNSSQNDDDWRGRYTACVYGYGQVTSTNDTLITARNTAGIHAVDLNMSGTIISNSSSSATEYYKAVYASGSLSMDNVTITGMRYPVYLTGTNGTIKNSTLVPVGDDGITATNADATLNIERVTIIGPGSGNGINMSADGTTLNMNSNVVDGFAAGLSAVSAPILYSNAFYNNTNNFSGSGIGSDLGSINTYNVNGDPSDLYGNIFMDPLFVDRSGGDYRPTAESPLVNAGAAVGLDLDGTVADIGREFYNFGYAPMNLTATDIQSGSISISWEIVATDSLTGYQPYYKEADSETWLYDPTAATSETNATYAGLTNNALYDFAVTAEYNSGSTISSRSATLQERPGVTAMTLSPKHLIISQDAGGSATGEYTVSNPGSRNLAVTIDLRLDLGTTTFTKTDYADWTLEENQDRITDTVWIARNINRGLLNYAVEDYHEHSLSPRGTEWAWGPTASSAYSYVSWRNAIQQPGCGRAKQALNQRNCGTPIMSLHLIEDDLYFDVTFNDWTTNQQGGGFSYTRTHISELGSGEGYDPYETTIEPGESSTRTKEFSGVEVGLHVGSIAVSSDDPDSPLDSIYTLNIVGTHATIPSVHFSSVDATGNIFYYVVQEASIDGFALETGDEIALFSGDLCVGAGVYNGVLPFLVRAYGAIPPDVPGFADGDPITVKTWDYGESRIATMTSVRNGGSSAFYSDGFSAVNLTGTIYYTQDIQITSGAFNLVSSYLYPQFPAAGTYFSGITGLGIVYEDNGAAYIPEYGINTIGNVNMIEGYHLYMDGGDQTLTVSGLVIDPANWAITLQPSQFNSIAYLHPAAMDVEDALTAIAGVISGEGGIVQDDAGNAWIPSLGVPMGNMTPGKGYQVFTTVDTAVSFTYATYSAPAARDVPEEERPEPSYFAFRRTGAPYTIVVQSAMIDGQPLEAGDEVAVFDGATCVGAVVWSENKPNVLSAWRGNEEFDLPGYLPGNAMNFQVYKKRLKKSAVVESEYMHTAEAFFDGSSYSRTALKGSPGLIPQQFALQQNYPNPFNPTTKLRFDVAENSQVTMVVYNLMGQEVARLLDNAFYEPGRYTMTWQALNKRGEQVSAGMYLVRMTTSGGFTATRKMVLLK